MYAFLKTSLPSFLLFLVCVVTSAVGVDGRLSSPVSDSQLHILLFETDRERVPDILLTKQINKAGISYSVFGTGAKFEGFGTKWGLALSALDDVPANDLVVISDGRDVLLNIHNNDKEHGRRTIEGFELAYRALTLNKPGAIVMSAEGQCCVSALTHAKPGSYFHANGTRAERACASGQEEGCLWAGDVHKLPWQNMMQELAKDTQGEYVRDSYLNAGLVAGRAKDIKRLIKIADMEAFEDDQAVFTDLLYTMPNLIVLDYAQEMFGNMRWTDGMKAGCLVALDKSKPTAGLVHTETQTVPLFLHTPGKFLECLDHLSESLEIAALPNDATQSQRRRRLRAGKNQDQRRTNYGNYGQGEVCDVVASTSAYGRPLPYDVKIQDLMSPNGTSVEGITISVHPHIKAAVNGTRRAEEMIGDIRGVFFHVRGDTVPIHDSDVIMATGPIEGKNFRGRVKIGKGSVDRIVGNVAIKRRGELARTYDFAIEIGTKGTGRDDIHETTITIMGLTTRDIQGEMAVLLTRVGERGSDRTRRGYRRANSAMIAQVPEMP